MRGDGGAGRRTASRKYFRAIIVWGAPPARGIEGLRLIGVHGIPHPPGTRPVTHVIYAYLLIVIIAIMAYDGVTHVR